VRELRGRAGVLHLEEAGRRALTRPMQESFRS